MDADGATQDTQDTTDVAEATDQQGTQDEQGTTTEQQADPTDRLMARMDQMAQQQAELLRQLNQAPEEEEYQPDPQDEGYDEWAAEQALRELVRSEAQNMVTPVIRDQNVRERDRAYDELTTNFPKLADPEFARQFINEAAEFAQRLNPGFIDTPEFVDLIAMRYKAHEADERARRERPAEQPRVQLEQGGGAAAAQAEQDDPQARMIERLKAKMAADRAL